MKKGKSYKMYIKLIEHLCNGEKCSVATINPNKFKEDFKRIFNINLIMEEYEDKNIYKVSLKQSDQSCGTRTAKQS